MIFYFIILQHVVAGELQADHWDNTLQALLARLRLREETVGVGAHTKQSPLSLVPAQSRDPPVLRSDWLRSNHVSRVLWWEAGGGRGRGD